jgi:hypothetical protein
VRSAVAIGVAALVIALPAPALAASQLRHFEGALPPAGVPSQPQPGGVLRLDVIFKDKHGRGKFTPRQLIAVNVDGLPFTSCTNEQGQATSGMLTGSFPTQGKFATTGRKPGQAKPKKNRYSYSTSYAFTSFAGTIGTRLYKVQGTGPVRFFGTLTVDRYDFPPPGPHNCSTAGPRGASGTQCRTSTESNALPLCRID